VNRAPLHTHFTYFSADPELASAIADELQRQQDGIELIASEKYRRAPTAE